MDFEPQSQLIPSNCQSSDTEEINQIVQMMTDVNLSQTKNKLSIQEIQVLRRATENCENQCSSIVQKGAIPLFISLLSSQDINFVEQALYSIGNIACTSTNFRNSIINLNGIDQLVQCLKRVSYSQKHLNLGLWAISNVCRGQLITYPVLEKMIPGVNILCQAIIKQVTFNQETLNDCLASIQYTLAQNIKGAQLLLNWGLIPRLFKFFNYQNSRLKIYALKIIGNLTRLKNVDVTSELFMNGAIQQVYSQINCVHLYARKSVCWIFSQIVSGTKKHASQLFELPHFLQNMLNLFKNDDIKVKKQLCIFFTNLCKLSDKQVVFNLLKQAHIVTYYIDFLTELNNMANHLKSIEYILVGLDSLTNILKLGQSNFSGDQNVFAIQISNRNGKQILTDLMGLPCETVQTKILKIQNKFFKHLPNLKTEANQIIDLK